MLAPQLLRRVSNSIYLETQVKRIFKKTPKISTTHNSTEVIFLVQKSTSDPSDVKNINKCTSPIYSLKKSRGLSTCFSQLHHRLLRFGKPVSEISQFRMCDVLAAGCLLQNSKGPPKYAHRTAGPTLLTYGFQGI